MLKKYAATLEKRGLDKCSSMILADVLEQFPNSISVKELASRTGKTEPIADDPEKIEMNPIWISDHLIYYIDLRDGSLNKLLLEKY